MYYNNTYFRYLYKYTIFGTNIVTLKQELITVKNTKEDLGVYTLKKK